MKYLVIFIIVLILYIVYSVGFIIYKTKTSKNPKIIQQDISRGIGPVIRYIAAGDSTAVGEGASSVNQTYPVLIADYLAQNHSVIYHNIAVSGSKTDDVLGKQLQEIISFNPDIITISISANDQTHFHSNDHIIENYQTIINKLLEKTHATIYITDVPNFTGVTLLPRIYVEALEQKTRYLNPRLQKLERERVKIVNIHDFQWDKFPDRTVTYSSDGFHPNDIGYENWAAAFIKRIKEEK